MLLGGMLCFWRLTRSSELVVARAAGVSAWEFLTAPTLCALAFGMLATTAVSPLSSVMFNRAEAMDNAYLKSGAGPLALTGGQLWLRQSDHTLSAQGVAIIHALGVELHGDRLTASQVSVFRLDGRDRLLSRIEAGEATLGAGAWQLQKARVIRPEQMPEQPATISLPTDLTVARVQESFASPDTLSFWTLPDFIALLDRSGFSSIRHRLHFQALLALPLFCAAMALVARRILHASGATRRRGTDDRQRCRDRIRIVPGVEDRRGVRPVRGVAGRTCRLGAGRVRHDAGGRAAVAHGRRLRMAQAFLVPMRVFALPCCWRYCSRRRCRARRGRS